MARGKKKASEGSGKQQRGKLVKIGALWLKHGNNGTFMSGTVSLDEENPNMTVKVLVFKNSYKEESKHPDYVVYIPADEKDRAEGDTEDGVPF